MDRLGNLTAKEGCDRCLCGCKYWENDCCIDCGAHIFTVRFRKHQEATDEHWSKVNQIVLGMPINDRTVYVFTARLNRPFN